MEKKKKHTLYAEGRILNLNKFQEKNLCFSFNRHTLDEMNIIKKNPNIDYDTQTFYGKLERQAPLQVGYDPIFKTYWTAEIEAKDSAKLMSFIKQEFYYTGELLKHIKRIKKSQSGKGSVCLEVVICPESDTTESGLIDQLKNIGIDNENYQVKTRLREIPMNKPFEKVVNDIWSHKYWPLVWKGNPQIQDLNELIKRINKPTCDKYMEMIVKLSKEEENVSFIAVDLNIIATKSILLT